jgi:putative ABC transport system substrate-binding protein
MNRQTAMTRTTCFATLTCLVLSLAATVAVAEERVWRLGVLGSASWSNNNIRTVTLPELAKRGFVEGRNLAVEVRFAEGDFARLPQLARELVDSKVDVIVAVAPDGIRAAREATRTIPIVMSFHSFDPVAEGIAKSLARPGGNVTGLIKLAADLDSKRLIILREAVPRAQRIAVLANEQSFHDQTIAAMQATARSLGVELDVVGVSSSRDYAAAFTRMKAAKADALVIPAFPLFFRDGATLAALALEAGLPTICEWREMAAQGCLLGYGPNLNELRMRTADFVARILEGTAPGEIPIEGPTRYEFAVNMKTARSLGLEFAPTVLVRADEVIE